MTSHNWIDLSQDADTGIETLRAHFEGHAYDPHGHDSYLTGAASLQLINPKTWITALAVASVFAGNGAEHQSQVVYLSLVFFLVSLPCLGIWALLGAGSSRVFTSPRAITRFNPCMALLLLSATWLSVMV